MAGPKFDFEWEFGVRLASLSTFSQGFVLTSGWAKSGARIGSYEVVTTLYESDTALQRFRASWRFFARGFSLLLSAKRRGTPFDALITYDPLATGLIGWFLAALFGVRLICEVNGDYTAVANFMHVPGSRRRAAKRWAAGALARFVLRRAGGIRTLYPSQLGNLGYEAHAHQVVMQYPEFVNTPAFQDLGEEPVVLLVGFPFYVKGVDVAIAAFRKIAHRHPGWRLVIMGYYPDRSEIDTAIGDCQSIVHHPPVHHRHMNAHIGKCGIVLQSSRTEAMGRVLVEAMAARKPRVASNVGGIPTVVANGVDGILVEAGDVDGFAAALETLMSDDALRKKLGDAGATRAAEEFSPERYAANVEALVAAVVARARG